MTKLEEEIAIHIQNEYEEDAGHGREYYYAKLGILAAEVAKKYIEAAYDSHFDDTQNEVRWVESREKWLKENGIE